MYAVMQMGYIDDERYATRAEAEAEAERLNTEMANDCGQDLGDGAATVVEIDQDGEVQ